MFRGVATTVDHLSRIIILIIIGCPRMNYGLTSIQSKSNLLQSSEMHHVSPSEDSSTIDRSVLAHINQMYTTNEEAGTSNVGSSSIDNDDHHDSVLENNQNDADLTMTELSNNMLEDIYRTPMHFGTENSTTVTTQIGATAHIPCTIHHIGEGVVSWIRKSDYHLLTVGLTTYSSDERFSATHLKHSEDWTLQVKFVQLRDAGVYECQVSTHPPTSIFLHLHVVEARAEIVGPPIKYLTPGSTLKLMCRIIQNTETSAFVFWYHDNRMINYDVDRGINVSAESDYHYSEMTILRARKEHSGNYTCVPSHAQPASVLVHIFKGDNPAAMYHDHRSCATNPYHMLHLFIVIAMAVWHAASKNLCIFMR